MLARRDNVDMVRAILRRNTGAYQGRTHRSCDGLGTKMSRTSQCTWLEYKAHWASEKTDSSKKALHRAVHGELIKWWVVVAFRMYRTMDCSSCNGTFASFLEWLFQNRIRSECADRDGDYLIQVRSRHVTLGQGPVLGGNEVVQRT